MRPIFLTVDRKRGERENHYIVYPHVAALCFCIVNCLLLSTYCAALSYANGALSFTILTDSVSKRLYFPKVGVKKRVFASRNVIMFYHSAPTYKGDFNKDN